MLGKKVVCWPTFQRAFQKPRRNVIHRYLILVRRHFVFPTLSSNDLKSAYPVTLFHMVATFDVVVPEECSRTVPLFIFHAANHSSDFVASQSNEPPPWRSAPGRYTHRSIRLRITNE
jgi:hypothetical protein